MSSLHRLKELREKFRDENGKKMSGIKMAKLLGITPQYYYDIEKGKRNLSADLAVKASAILDVSIDYLLNKTDINIDFEKLIDFQKLNNIADNVIVLTKRQHDLMHKIKENSLDEDSPEMQELIEAVNEATEYYETTAPYIESQTKIINKHLDEIKDQKTLSHKNNEEEFFEEFLDLSDEEVKAGHTFMIDGRELTEEEFQRMIAAVRLERHLRDQQ